MDKIEKKFASAKASVEIEGYKVSSEIEKLIIKEAKKEITFDQFTKEMKRLSKDV